MDRETAYSIVQKYITSNHLINHMLAVEAAMRFYALKLQQDVETWGMTGLLHDFDWEKYPTPEQHATAGAPILREQGVPEEIIQAILSHADYSGVPRNTPLAKALFACDELTGLVTAVALVRPSRSLYDLTSSSVKKKWKDRAFAAGANREEIAAAAADFGVDLWQHTDNVIIALRSIAPQLGLEGNLRPNGLPAAF
ncbi:metal dependent phosphohydrolase [Longilinea arvoryzae]|uniref:Metal dependent phosphohydrolase n=1 Tax=Longilinea arvoryzae TaxID=360412 RepID=A0A0S7BA34_9CHLR|nr:HD domain-containing protein [Longilinea arvoryzae]GAP14428.1 metal dependent phosphohydrolase [Longilinea arvoryzae]